MVSHTKKVKRSLSILYFPILGLKCYSRKAVREKIFEKTWILILKTKNMNAECVMNHFLNIYFLLSIWRPIRNFWRRKYLQEISLAKTVSKHSRKKSHKCEVCGKGFSTNSCLAIHMKSHTSEAPPHCEVCGKCFFSINSNLNVHMRMHTGKKPFYCEVCGKTFSYFSGLNTHMKTHTGEKPFLCDVCGKESCSEKPQENSYRRKTFQLQNFQETFF